MQLKLITFSLFILSYSEVILGFTYDAKVVVDSYSKNAVDITISRPKDFYAKKFKVTIHTLAHNQCLVAYGFHDDKEPTKGGVLRFRIPALPCSGDFDITVTPSSFYQQDGRMIYPCYDPTAPLDMRTRTCPDSTKTVKLFQKSLKQCKQMKIDAVCDEKVRYLIPPTDSKDLRKTPNESHTKAPSSSALKTSPLTSGSGVAGKQIFKEYRQKGNLENIYFFLACVITVGIIGIFIVLILVYLGLRKKHYPIHNAYNKVNSV